MNDIVKINPDEVVKNGYLESAPILTLNQIIEIVNRDGVYVGKVALNIIEKNPDINARKNRDEAFFEELKEDVKENGVNQSISLRIPAEVSVVTVLEVVAGNTRFDASVATDKTWIPATVKRMTFEEAKTESGVENIKRSQMTPIEEGDYAARELIRLNNDTEKLFRLLRWGRSKLNSRLALSYAIPELRAALANKKVDIGHVEQLVTLREETQLLLLDMIIAENITIDGLKKVIESKERNLSAAKFNTEKCNGCQFNTSVVSDLFSGYGDGGKCRNSKCWTEKTQAHVATVVESVKPDYGTVRLQSELAKNSTVDLVETGSRGVGADQLSACASCQHFGAVICDKEGSEGEVRQNVCFDLSCNSEKVTQYKNLIASDRNTLTDSGQAEPSEPSSNAQHAPKKPDPKNDTQRVSTPTKPTLTVDSISKALKRIAFKAFQSTAIQVADKNENIFDALTVLMMFRGCVQQSELRNQMASVVPAKVRNEHEIFKYLCDTDSESRAELKVIMAKHFISTFDNAESFEADRTAKNILIMLRLLDVDMKEYWSVDADYLKAQTRQGILNDLTSSGFEESFKAANSDKAFNTLKGEKLPELIKAVMNFNAFEWKGFLPKFMDYRFYFNKKS